MTKQQAAALRALVGVIPPLPLGPRPYQPKPTTDTVYLPASETPAEGPRNTENIELHAVFPFRLTHVGEDESLMNMSLARTTFAQRMFVCDANAFWCEDGNVASLLGLAEEAGRDVLAAVSPYLSQTSPGWRFPIWHGGTVAESAPSVCPPAAPARPPSCPACSAPSRRCCLVGRKRWRPAAARDVSDDNASCLQGAETPRPA